MATDAAEIIGKPPQNRRILRRTACWYSVQYSWGPPSQASVRSRGGDGWTLKYVYSLKRVSVHG